MNEQMISLSSITLLIAFFLYLLAIVFFVVTITGRGMEESRRKALKEKWGRSGFLATALGFLFHFSYWILRWIGKGDAPVSSMFEFMSLLALAIVLGYLIIYWLYRSTTLGVFTLPLVVSMLGWASVFDKTPQPLIPALQSHWLTLHVSTVALGEGLFAVGFAAGLMYLIRTIDKEKAAWHRIMLEVCLALVLMLVAFVGLSFLFSFVGYEAQFNYVNEQGQEQLLTYTLPPLVGPPDGQQMTQERMQPIFESPTWLQGRDAPRKLNTILWSVLVGGLVYLLLRLIIRRPIAEVIKPLLADLSPSLLDEICYRAIIIAFPVFTLGGLIFAMIWAEQAWGRFWGWDPKEVWALITWLFYAAYIHLRLSRGWHGLKSAWLAVLGFVIIMFNLVFVNLVIAGMHSYVSG
jgi:cytochrome c-type biogenesis protein CcsB